MSIFEELPHRWYLHGRFKEGKKHTSALEEASSRGPEEFRKINLLCKKKLESSYCQIEAFKNSYIISYSKKFS